MPAEGARRPAWVEVDLGAVAHNASVLAAIASPARLCAVVKADGYGHSAVPVARAALAGGASELAVALADEGVELREAGIDAPVLLLSEPRHEAMADVIANRLTPTLYTAGGVAAAREVARALAGRGGDAGRITLPVPVEVKADTGMHRVGAPLSEVAAVVREIAGSPELSYGGLWTHLAVADDLADPFTGEQLARLEAVREALGKAGLPEPGRVHAANSAATIAFPHARHDMVRCGISLYGYSPSRQVAPVLAAELERVGAAPLRPVLSLKAEVSLVRDYDEGERLSYGRVAPLTGRSAVATVPLGYADGVSRGYFPAGGEVLLAGRRCRLAGTVTMDQILVCCPPGATVRPGDEAVLIGSQEGEAITAEEWAERLGTICYEVVTRIGPRVPRRFTGRLP